MPGADRYNNVAILLHWSIAVLVILNLVIGLGHDALPRAWGVMPIHKAIGITVLFLSVVRLGWRLAHTPPPFVATTRAWERALASTVHWLFYVLLIVVPLTGWLMVSGTETRRPLTFFGLFDIPYLPVGIAAGDFGHESHEVLGLLMAALVILHIGAALLHQFVKRDVTLSRMFPPAKQGG
ncbi:MAG: cytochrome B [Alphaproteobacteria bacterium HGW-Alphaproteobacteria-16]|nr:MAG: cytochrome B [Alphaproteobacteria bacterium HGW-Alphaproteobacteria-16]